MQTRITSTSVPVSIEILVADAILNLNLALISHTVRHSFGGIGGGDGASATIGA
jgi:hypothetical protein